MRSFLHPSSQRVIASPTSFTCLITSCRCVFTRESWTPVTLQPDGTATAAAPLPARLLWQYRSSTPRHLTLCLRRPARTNTTTAAAAASGGCDDAQESSDAQGRSLAAESGNLEDYMYGRLFLRPYNVAQLLTVLQGWSEGPAVVERTRASLQLTPVSENSNSSSVPTAVKLTARLTRKGMPPSASASSQSAAAAAGSAYATPNTDVDPSASEDYPGSFYLDGQVGTVTAVLRNEDLVFLTSHLESVLSDFFSMEHQTIRDAVRRGVDRQNSFSPRRAPTHPPGRYASASQTQRASSAVPPPQQPPRSHRYLSDRYTASRSTFASEKAPAAAAAAPSTQPASRAALAQTSISMDELLDAEDVAGETVENIAEDVWESTHAAEAETARISAAAAASEAAASSTLAATAEIEDEYEEVVEEVEMEEEEEIGDASAAAAAATTSFTNDAATPHSAADAFDLDASSTTPEATPAPSQSVSYHASHVRDSGTATIESENRYATGRFVRDGSVAAAEVAEVSRIGDFDVVRRTQLAQGATETDGARTTVSATQTSGAFRSASGDVKGTFSYERVATVTASSSVAPAAAAAAAGAIPVRRPDAAAEDDAADEGGDEEGPTMVVPAKSVKAVESEQTEKAATAAAQPAKEAAKQKRASTKSGGKRSNTKKKKKATRRTAAAKDTSAAEMVSI